MSPWKTGDFSKEWENLKMVSTTAKVWNILIFKALMILSKVLLSSKYFICSGRDSFLFNYFFNLQAVS
jgi:hypothetical protein